MEEQTPQTINTESKPTPPLTSPAIEPKKGFNKKIFAIAVILVLLIAGGASAYFIVNKPTPKAPIQTVMKPTPTPDPTADWKTFTGNGFSYKYPANWQNKANFISNNDMVVFDPASLKSFAENGGGQIQLPTIFFDVQQIITTTQTAKSYADEFTSAVPYNTAGGVLNRESNSASDLQMELFTAEGEGSSGKYLILSNGQKIAVINTSLKSFGDNNIENQILSTFKFTTPNPVINAISPTSAPQAVSKSFESKTTFFSVNFPETWNAVDSDAQYVEIVGFGPGLQSLSDYANTKITVHIDKSSFPNKQDANGELQMTVSAAKSRAGYTTDSTQNITLGGAKAFENTSVAGDGTTTVVIADHNGATYIITNSGATADQFNQFISSFRFTQ